MLLASQDVPVLSGETAVFLLIDPSPDNPPVFLGPYALDGLEEELGEVVLHRRRSRMAPNRYEVVSDSQGPAEAVTGSLIGDLLPQTVAYVATLRKAVSIIMTVTTCGRLDTINGFDSAYLIKNARLTSRGLGNTDARNDTLRIEREVSFSAWPPVRQYAPYSQEVHTPITEPVIVYGLVVAPSLDNLPEPQYQEQPFSFQKAYALTSSNSTGIWLSSDQGYTYKDVSNALWSLRTPYAGVYLAQYGRLVMFINDTTNNAGVVYTDNDGSTLTIVDNAMRFTSGFYGYMYWNGRLWAITQDGEVWISEGDATEWELVQLGVFSSSPGVAIFRHQGRVYAMHTDGVISSSREDGTDWLLSGNIGTGTTYRACSSGPVIWASTSVGLYYSKDNGEVWDQKLITNNPEISSITGPYRAIEFWDETFGVASRDTTVFYTIDGGFSWKLIADMNSTIYGLTIIRPGRIIVHGAGGLLTSLEVEYKE